MIKYFSWFLLLSLCIFELNGINIFYLTDSIKLHNLSQKIKNQGFIKNHDFYEFSIVYNIILNTYPEMNNTTVEIIKPKDKERFQNLKDDDFIIYAFTPYTVGRDITVIFHKNGKYTVFGGK
jgi:hypothetical protein